MGKKRGDLQILMDSAAKNGDYKLSLSFYGISEEKESNIRSYARQKVFDSIGNCLEKNMEEDYHDFMRLISDIGIYVKEDFVNVSEELSQNSQRSRKIMAGNINGILVQYALQKLRKRSVSHEIELSDYLKAVSAISILDDEKRKDFDNFKTFLKLEKYAVVE